MSKINMTFGHASHTTLHSQTNSLMSLTRTGGSGRKSAPYATFDANWSSHMPIDTDIHWDWRNPLNIIPATAIGSILLGIISLWM